MTESSPPEGSPPPAAPRDARRPCRERWLLLAFPLLALLLLWPVLLGGRVLLPAEYLRGFSPWSQGLSAEALRSLPQWNVLQWDGLAQFYPWRQYLVHELSAGRIPLWNPFVLCGTPFLANSQSAPLYPPHWLLLLPLGSVAARMGWLAFLHLSLAGGFSYLLARDMGVRPLAALVTGIAFELSGFMVAWLELPSVPEVACWIPLVLLLVGMAVRHGSARRAAAAGVGVGLMLLAGHLQIAFYGLLAAGLVWLWETIARIRRPGAAGTVTELVRSAGAGLLTLGLGLCLAAPQFLSSLELSRLSHRAGPATAAGFQSYVGYALPAQNWITLLVPDYYGLPGRSDFWGMWNFTAPNVMEYAGHVGLAALLLAIVGLVWGWRVTRKAGQPLLLIVLSLLLATGTPLAALFYFGIPGFAQTGSPARVLVLFCLAQAVLAGVGLEALLRRVEERWTTALVPLAAGLGGTLALLAGAYFAADAALPADGNTATLLAQVSLPALVRSVLMVLCGAGLLALLAWLLRENRPEHRSRAMAAGAALLAAGGLLMLDMPYNLTAAPSTVYPNTPITTALQSAPGRVATLNREWELQRQAQALLPPDSSLAYGWRDAQGYDSLWLANYRRLIDAVALPEKTASPLANGNIAFVKHITSPLFPLLGARYVVSQAPLSRADLAPAAGAPVGPPYLYEDRSALPEAFLASTWVRAEDALGLDQLRELPNSALHHTALVGTAAPAPVPGAAPPPSVALERISPQHFRVALEPTSPSLLVLLEGYMPGWKATIHPADGEPRATPVMRANVAFQAVSVVAGKQTVEWRYEPASFRVGLFIGLAALAFVFGLVVRPRA